MNKKELGALIIDGTDDFYRVAKSILKEDADCQDAVQEAVSKAFAKIDTLREKKYAKTWFIRILLNECYRMLRQRKREAAYHEQISGEEVRQHQYSDLYQKIMSLEIEYRVPLVLYYLNQYTIKEIGQMLDLGDSAVKMRLSLAFYARPTGKGKRCQLNSDRLAIGDAVYMIHFDKLSDEAVKENEGSGVKKGDYKGTVQLGARDVPDSFTASLIVDAGSLGTQTISFDVKLDENAIIKQAQNVITEDGVIATVDALKIAESGTYIHVTWEFDESQKELYDKMSSEGGGNQVVFMALDDNNGNHFTTEDNMDTRQTIVFTVDGDDWSGAEQRKSYEANGKYYREMFGIIEGMNQDVTSLTVTPYVRTGVEDGEEHTYTNLDFAAFTVEYDE